MLPHHETCSCWFVFRKSIHPVKILIQQPKKLLLGRPLGTSKTRHIKISWLNKSQVREIQSSNSIKQQTLSKKLANQLYFVICILCTSARGTEYSKHSIDSMQLIHSVMFANKRTHIMHLLHQHHDSLLRTITEGKLITEPHQQEDLENIFRSPHGQKERWSLKGSCGWNKKLQTDKNGVYGEWVEETNLLYWKRILWHWYQTF